MRVKQQVESINNQQPPSHPEPPPYSASAESVSEKEARSEGSSTSGSTPRDSSAHLDDSDGVSGRTERGQSRSGDGHVFTGPKIWKVKGMDLRLSALEATVAVKSGAFTYEDLEVYTPPSNEPVDQGPADPLSGGFSAVIDTLGNVAQRVGDYPILLGKVLGAKEEGEAEHEIAEFAKDSGKGVTGLGGAVLKAPMDITHNLSRGFHNLPKMYGDETVRPLDKVTDVQSGLQAAGKGFGFGLWDGVSGLVTQPIKGAQEGGWMGGLMGLGKGVGGVVFKPAAGVLGIPGYVSKGIYEEVRTNQNPGPGREVFEAQIVQGFRAWEAATEEERKVVLRQIKREVEDLQTLEG